MFLLSRYISIILIYFYQSCHVSAGRLKIEWRWIWKPGSFQNTLLLQEQIMWFFFQRDWNGKLSKPKIEIDFKCGNCRVPCRNYTFTVIWHWIMNSKPNWMKERDSEEMRFPYQQTVDQTWNKPTNPPIWQTTPAQNLNRVSQFIEIFRTYWKPD